MWTLGTKPKMALICLIFLVFWSHTARVPCLTIFCKMTIVSMLFFYWDISGLRKRQMTILEKLWEREGCSRSPVDSFMLLVLTFPNLGPSSQNLAQVAPLLFGVQATKILHSYARSHICCASCAIKCGASKSSAIRREVSWNRPLISKCTFLHKMLSKVPKRPKVWGELKQTLKQDHTLCTKFAHQQSFSSSLLLTLKNGSHKVNLSQYFPSSFFFFF